MSIEREFMTMLGAARAMQEMLNTSGGRPPSTEAGWSPPTDVFETADSVVIQMELPCANPADLSIQACATSVCIQGRRADPNRGAKTRIHRMEIYYGPFSRLVELPCPVNAKQTRARYEKGMLDIVLPKARRRSKVGMIVTIEL